MILETLEVGTITVQWSETLTSGWTDITGVIEIHQYAKYAEKDYKYARDQMKAHVASLGGGNEEAGFALLSAPEMGIAAQYNIGSHAQQLAVLGIDNLIDAGQYYAYQVYQARLSRLSRATSEIFNRLHANKDEVLDDMTNETLLVTFTQGREGTEYGDPEGLIDYIKGVTGTKYAVGGSLEGLEHKGWIPLGMTMTQFTDLLVDILVNGNYQKNENYSLN